MTLAFPYHSANEYINTEDNSSSLALDKSGHDGGKQWTCTETSFVWKKWLCNSKKKTIVSWRKERALDWFRIFNLVKERKAKTEIRFGRNIFGQSMFEPYTLFPVLMSTTFSLEFFFSTRLGLTNVLKMSIKAMQRFGKHKVMYYTMCTQRKLW